ncbi:RloB family protein [Halostreptopolyspora alba]|uniref:RloB domain-containing protein n=1 Tax=Halostreptopolyspora alba TaxID=2487137 RepID=A0A3N0ECH5_9ACTN|nr:RloB domain-containing protein [Nocardiopsaceae bacterium YIM 96095]
MAAKSKRASLAPKTRRRAERKRYLVFCEDENAGRRYFGGLGAELRVPMRVPKVHGEALGLVRAAVKRARNPSRRDQGREFDEVWCVMDVEAPKPQPALGDALELAERNGINCALTNPCFEFWLLLHQRNHEGYLTTEKAESMMRGLGCCYTRGKDFTYEHFTGEQRFAAIQRAERLAELFEIGDDPRRHNPSTSVHLLVRELLRSA